MNLRRLFWLMLPLALAALMFGAVACGDDDDDSEGNGGESSNEDGDDDSNGGSETGDDGDSGSDGDDPDSPDSDTDDDSDGGSGNSGSDDGDDDGDSDSGSGSSGSGGTSEDGLEVLRETAGALDAGTYLVTYEMAGEGLDGTFTFASKPPASLIGIEGTFDGEAGTLLLINDGEFQWFCSDSGGEQGCLKMRGGDGGLIPVEIPTLGADELAESILESPGVAVTPAAGQTIAGIDADCWDVVSEGDEATICVGDGVFLLMEGTIEGSEVSMRAQEVELDAGDVDITVPDWPVQDLTSAGG